MRFDIATHLNILRTIYNVSHNELNNSIMKVVSYMLDFEAAKKQVVNLYDRHFIEEVLETRHWITRYFVTPSPAEGIGKILKERVKGSKKTIAWDDEMNLLRRKLTSEKNEFIPNRNLKKKQVTGKKSKESITHFSTTENLDFILKSIGNKL